VDDRREPAGMAAAFPGSFLRETNPGRRTGSKLHSRKYWNSPISRDAWARNHAPVCQ